MRFADSSRQVDAGSRDQILRTNDAGIRLERTEGGNSVDHRFYELDFVLGPTEQVYGVCDLEIEFDRIHA
jgi:hypothetical protein